jgi:hypothetical protein
MPRADVEPHRCIGCNEALTARNNSDAHVIPNALGGCLSATGILCSSANGALNELADKPLIEAFGAWPTILDVPRDRAGNPPAIFKMTTGHRIRQDADGGRTQLDHVYSQTEMDDGLKIEISTPTWKAMRQRIAQVKKQHPQFDTEAALKQAMATKVMPEGLESLPVNFHPIKVFPGVFAALWLFCIVKTGHVLMPWSKLISLLVNFREGRIPLHLRYLPDGLPGLRGPDIPITHRLVLRTVPSKGLLIGYAQILEGLRVGGVLAEIAAPSSLDEFICVDDVFGGQRDRSGEFSIDAAIFDNTDWRSVGLDLNSPEAELKGSIRDALGPLIERKLRREIRLDES